MEDGSTREEPQESGTEFPWKAPRIILQHLEWKTNTEEPCQRSIDDCDGAASWKECKQRPREEYREDAELITNQYQKIANGMYQWENKIEDFIGKWRRDSDQEQNRQTWQEIRNGIKLLCATAHREVMDEKSDDVKPEEEKRIAQRKFQEEQRKEDRDGKQLAMFEKCKGQKQRRHREEEDASDDEEDCKLVCNMIGAQ